MRQRYVEKRYEMEIRVREGKRCTVESADSN